MIPFIILFTIFIVIIVIVSIVAIKENDKFEKDKQENEKAEILSEDYVDHPLVKRAVFEIRPIFDQGYEDKTEYRGIIVLEEEIIYFTDWEFWDNGALKLSGSHIKLSDLGYNKITDNIKRKAIKNAIIKAFEEDLKKYGDCVSVRTLNGLTTPYGDYYSDGVKLILKIKGKDKKNI